MPTFEGVLKLGSLNWDVPFSGPLNWGYLQLGLFALAFGGLQVWWIGSTQAFQKPNGNQSIAQNPIHWVLSVPETLFGWYSF